MRMMKHLGICILTVLVVQTTTQYYGEVLHGRQFDIFNLPIFQRVTGTQFNALLSRVSAQEGTVASLKNQVTSLTNQLTSTMSQLTTQLTSLTTQIANSVITCPTSARAGAKLSGIYCYSYTSTPTLYTAAQQACVNAGGFLPEPVPILTSIPPANTTHSNLPLFNTLKALFPSIGTNNLWIGVQVPIGNITGTPVYASTMQPVANFPISTFFASPAFQGYYLLGSNGVWTLGATTVNNTAPTVVQPYVCQYNAI